METITNIISHSLNIEKYFESNNVCFIDIETTGLNRNSNMIYLIGVLYFDYDTSHWTLNQYFANTMDKEQKLLESFVDDMSNFDKLLTFNGESFDFPFIEHRLNKYGVNYIFDKTKSFDLYQLVKKNRYYLNLPNLKLKTIELSLGFIREDKYSGYDCIGFYYDYIKSGNILLKENILKHNYDDLVHMLDIIKIIDVLDDKKSFYIDIDNTTIKFAIEDIQINGDMVNISGNLASLLENNIKYYSENYSIITEDYNKFIVSIEFQRGYITEKEKCVYIDISKIEQLEKLKDTTGYKLPSNILVLMVEKKYCIDNIKNILKEIFKGIIRQ